MECVTADIRHTQLRFRSNRAVLQDSTAALLSERIHLLAGEANEQAILLLVLGDKLHDLANGLSYRNALDCSFATQLFRHRPGSEREIDEMSANWELNNVECELFRELSVYLVR